jgi:SOS-response transcriptional repressor LexA
VAELTAKQQAVLNFIADFVQRHGYQPSLREMAESFGVNHNAIRGHLTTAAHKGKIEILDGGYRSIRFRGDWKKWRTKRVHAHK